MANIAQYKILKELGYVEHLTFYLVEETGTGLKGCLRLINQPEYQDSWFDLYQSYDMEITNYKHLPKCLKIDSCSIKGTFSVMQEYDGDFLKEGQKLDKSQTDQLFDAIWHLHKKEFVHGNISKENIWIKENGDIILYGAGEYKVFQPNIQLDFHDDIRQLLTLITNNTILSSLPFQNRADLSLQEIRQWVHDNLSEPHHQQEEEKDKIEEIEKRPGLIEKQEFEIQPENESLEQEEIPDWKQPKKGQVPEPIQVEERALNKGISIWIKAIIGIALIMIVGSSIIWLQDEKQNANSFTKKEIEQETTAIPNVEIEKQQEGVQHESEQEGDLSKFNHLFPDWKIIKGTSIQIKDSKYSLFAIGQSRDEFSGALKISILSETSKGEWSIVSETPEYETYLTDPESYISSFLTLTPSGEDKALLVFDIPDGGSAGYKDIIAMSIHANGTAKEVWNGIGYGIKEEADTISVEEIGKKNLAIVKGEFTIKEIPRSEVAPSNAIKILFDINEVGQVVPVEQKELSFKVGDTIAFIPANEEVKRKFDLGEITIYTNINVVGGDMSLSNAYMYKHGNYFTFDSPGEFQFVFEYYEGKELDFENPEPTFVTIINE